MLPGYDQLDRGIDEAEDTTTVMPVLRFSYGGKYGPENARTQPNVQQLQVSNVEMVFFMPDQLAVASEVRARGRAGSRRSRRRPLRPSASTWRRRRCTRRWP